MIPLLIFLFSLSFCFAHPSTKLSKLTGESLVNYINSAQSSFVAENNDLHTRYTLMEPHFAERKPRQNETILTKSSISPDLPAHFDSRDHWPDCESIRLIRNQENCGSCWAFAIAEVISDRTCILSHGADRPILSPEDILSCCGEQCGYGCRGGWPVEALKWWNTNGVVTGGDFGGGGCEPYSIGPCTEEPCDMAPTPQCKTTCQKGYDKEYLKDKRHGATVYQVDSSSDAIMTDIFINGPVEASFQVYEDLYKYRSGIYHHTAGKHLGAHAVKIIGWGTENNEDYWLIANSWGRGFGEGGFMRFRRGNNECGLEGNVVTGRPGFGSFIDDVEYFSSAELQFL